MDDSPLVKLLDSVRQQNNYPQNAGLGQIAVVQFCSVASESFLRLRLDENCASILSRELVDNRCRFRPVIGFLESQKLLSSLILEYLRRGHINSFQEEIFPGDAVPDRVAREDVRALCRHFFDSLVLCQTSRKLLSLTDEVVSRGSHRFKADEVKLPVQLAV